MPKGKYRWINLYPKGKRRPNTTRLDVLQLKCLFSFGELRFFCFLALLYSQVYLGSASNSTRFYKNIGFYTERVALDLRKLRG